MLCLDVLNQPLCQVYVLDDYLFTIPQFEDFQILTEGNETLLLALLLGAYCGQLVLQFSHTDACIDGTTGIDHLLRLHGQRVPPARGRETLYIREVTVCDEHITIHRYRCRCTQLGQSLCARCLNSLLSKFYAYLLFLKSLAVAFHQLKQFVNCQSALLLGLCRIPCGYNHQQRHCCS